MPDIRLVQNTAFPRYEVTVDWCLQSDGTLDTDQALATAIIVALGTDALASREDILPDPDSTFRAGWWGDLETEEIWDGWPIGCKLWLMKRSKIEGPGSRYGSTVVRIDQYIRDAIQPFIDRRICSAAEVQVTRVGLERIEAYIQIYRGPRLAVELRYEVLWDELLAYEEAECVSPNNAGLGLMRSKPATISGVGVVEDPESVEPDDCLPEGALVYIDLVGECLEKDRWVPEGAAIHIDFIGRRPVEEGGISGDDQVDNHSADHRPQGRAWVAGSGLVPIETLIGTDPNSIGWDVTLYAPDQFLYPEGYKTDGRNFAFIGIARDMIAAGCTMRVQMRGTKWGCTPFIAMCPNSGTSNDFIVVETGTQYSPTGYNTNYVEAQFWASGRPDVSLSDPVSNDLPIKRGVYQINVFAWTYTPSRLEVAVNGYPDIIETVISAADRPQALVTFMMETSADPNAIQSITIYPPLPSTAGLRELSSWTWTPYARAWVKGVGEVPVESVLGSDPNSCNWWDCTSYNIGFLTSRGYVYEYGASSEPPDNPRGPVALIGAARDLLVGETGATIRYDWMSGDYTSGDGLMLYAANGGDGLYVGFGGDSVWLESDNGDAYAEANGVHVEMSGYINCIATTFRPTDVTYIDLGKWNPADLNHVTLSGGDLIATSTDITGGVRSHVHFYTESVYWEFKLGSAFAGTNSSVGIGTLDTPLSSTGTTMAAVVRKNGNIFVNNVDTGVSLGPLAPSSTIGVAIDFWNGWAWFRVLPAGLWNNNATAAPVPDAGPEAGGVNISAIYNDDMYPLALFAANNDQVTLVFDADDFVGTAPDNFSAGLFGSEWEWEAAVNKIPTSLMSTALVSADRPPGNPFTGAMFELAPGLYCYSCGAPNELIGRGGALRTITIYPPLPSTDGLVELSDNHLMPSEVVVVPYTSLPKATGVLDNLPFVTGAFSVSRNLLSTFAGPKYDIGTLGSNDVNVWRNQATNGATSNLQQLLIPNRPTLVNAGPNNIAALDFDGVDDQLSGGTTTAGGGLYNATGTVWDAATATNVTLSNSNRTATASGAGGVRAQFGFSSGCYYFEIACTTLTDDNTAIGITTAGAPYNIASAIAVVHRNGYLYVQGVQITGHWIVQNPGDALGFAVDMDRKKIWVRNLGFWYSPTGFGHWNGDFAADPASDTGGISLGIGAGVTVYPVFIAGKSGEEAVANFLPPFIGTVPNNPVDNHLAAGNMYNFIRDISGSVYVSFMADAIVSNHATTKNNECVVGDSVGGMGIYLKYTPLQEPTPETVFVGMNNDGAEDKLVLPLGARVPCVIEWTHDGFGVGGCVLRSSNYPTSYYTSFNSGPTASLMGMLRIGSALDVPDATSSFDGKIFELVVLKEPIYDPKDRNLLIADMLAHVQGPDSEGAGLTIDTNTPAGTALGFIKVNHLFGVINYSTFMSMNYQGGWNGCDKTDAVILTEMGTQAARQYNDNNAGYAGVRATNGLTAKHYFEIETYNFYPDSGLGVAQPTVKLPWYAALWADGDRRAGVAYVDGTGAIIIGGVSSGVSLGAFSSSNDLLCCAIDLTATPPVIWFRRGAAGNWNADAGANPETGAGGLDISAIGGGTLYATVNWGRNRYDAPTLNLGRKAFLGVLPLGFAIDTRVSYFDLTATQGNNWYIPNKLVALEPPAGTHTVTIGASFCMPVPPPKTITVTVLDAPAPPSPTLATMDGIAQMRGLAISKDKLTVTRRHESVSGNIYAGVRSATAKKTGKWYFECKIIATGASYTWVGIIKYSADANYYNLNNEAFYVELDEGHMTTSGAMLSTTLGQIRNGDFIGCAADLSIGRIWYRRNGGDWNNSPTADPTLGAAGGGATLPSPGATLLAPFFRFGGGYDQWDYSMARLNFGDRPYKFPAPTGFNNWPVADPPVPVTLDPATVTSVTLSGGDLVATSTGTTSTNQGVRVADTYRMTNGRKVYFEVTLTTVTGGANRAIWIGNKFLDYTSGQLNGARLDLATGAIAYNGGASGKTLGARAQGDVIGIAADFINGKIWFRAAPSGSWNGDPAANPETGIGATTLSSGAPIFTFGGTGGVAGNVLTANFGGSMVGAPPAGFEAGWLFPPG